MKPWLNGVNTDGKPNTPTNVGIWNNATKGSPLNIFAHVTTPPIETFGLKLIGKNVDVNQELSINLDANGLLKINMVHGTYPSVEMMVGNSNWYQYQQQSFLQSHATRFWGVSAPLWVSHPAFFIRLMQREQQAINDNKSMNQNYQKTNKVGPVKLNDTN